MEYYYAHKDKVDKNTKLITIDDFEYKHLTKVLRKKTGDTITVTDGDHNIFHCSIIEINKERMFCRINMEEHDVYEPEIKVRLYISPLRNSSRFEFAIEKAVEIGVMEIVPVITDFTVNKASLSAAKNERLNKIMIGAMGQSQRCVLPKLSDSVDFNVMIENEKDTRNKIVMYEFSSDKSNAGIDFNNKNISLLIGPEGGFSKREISFLGNAGWQIKSLGERKLRAETAAIVSLFDLINSNLTSK